ncbi:TPA: His-Xaa-Ser repeat protein HxsA, partial [Aeromonas veronii]
GVTASEAHLSDDAFNQLNLDNLPNMEASLNMDVNNLYAGHRSHRSHSSHRSHYSGYGTSTYSAPVAVPSRAYGSSVNSLNQSLQAPLEVTSPARRLTANDSAMMDLVMRVQLALFTKGYDVGIIDGKIGPKTRAQIKRYQSDNRLSSTGTLTTSLLTSLGIQIQ